MSVKGRGFEKLDTVAQARELFLNNIDVRFSTEKIPSSEATGRRLAEDISAEMDLPGFRRSAMDGFAVVATNTHGASDTSPIQLRIAGTVEIGDVETPILEEGNAIRISTGAPLPEGANAVIKIEDTEILGKMVEIYTAVPKGKNVALPDEDVKKGTTVLEKGTVLQPWDIAMLEALVCTEVEVFLKPQIGTLSTGNELVPSGGELVRGQVIDSNRPALNAWIEMIGGEVSTTKHCLDEPDSIRDAFIELGKNCQIIITTGGTSAGTRDYIPEIIEEMGELWVHGVAIRPGKPVALGKIRVQDKDVPIIGLPGYPLAAFLNFHLFASYILTRWTGIDPLFKNRKKVVLNQKIASRVGIRDFVRLKADGERNASVLRVSGAGILSSLVNADYLLEVPEDSEGYNSGHEVEVVVLR